MSIYRCSQCGCRIEVQEGTRLGTCPACQALFVLPNQFAQKENLYLLAADARHSGNYDMALNYYSRILKVDGAEPEANWGYLLSKYGAEISENAMDYGRVLFHRVEHGSFLKDPACEKMMTYVPQASRYYYESMAREIDAQHRKLMAISQAMTPPDICIDCTAAPGTGDYLLSVQIGKALEDAGYRIFHPAMASRVERKDLNLYEMAAAEKAEAMLVVMTPETNREDARFRALWQRFLAYRRQDAGRKLLSVFRGMRPEELPLELQALQSVACEGSDFQIRLVAEINRMFGRQNRSSALIKKNLELLRKGQSALEERRWEEAEGHFAAAVAGDGEEYRAHWGIVCALTQGLSRPVLSDGLDHHYRQALQYADKETAGKYLQSMTALQAQAAWARLLEVTGGLKNYRKEEEPEVQKAEERAKLYLPAFDSRFQELEDWHLGARRQRELDELQQAYERRDTAVEPLFAEQEKIEYAYQNTELSHSKRLDSGGRRALLLELSAVAMVLSYVLLLINCRYCTDYSSGWYKMSAAGFIFSLACVVFWLRSLSDEGWILPGGAVAVFACFQISRHQIRPFHLYLILLPLVLLAGERIMMMILAKNARDAWEMKRKASGAVMEIGERLCASYRTAVEGVYARYRLPQEEAPELELTHSQYYSGIAKQRKEASPFSYLFRTLVFLAALIAAVTVGSNLLYASGWKDIVKVDARYYHALGLRSDGTVRANGMNDAGQCDVSDWTDIADIGTGRYYSAGLTEQGTVLIAGTEDGAILAAQEWTDIVALSTGGYHVVGLRSDGTVVSAGANDWGENAVSDWTDVVQVLALSENGNELTCGLRSDGKVLLAGGGEGTDYDRIRQVVEERYGSGEGQTEAAEIYGNTASVAVRGRDGSFTGFGNNNYNLLSQMEEQWAGLEIRKVSLSSGTAALGLLPDGSVLCTGNNTVVCDGVSGWSDITDVAAGVGHVMGLRSDGTVVAAGTNNVGQLETEDWKEISQIVIGNLASFGIRENGSVEAAGYSYGGLTYVNAKNPLELLGFWYEALKW